MRTLNRPRGEEGGSLAKICAGGHRKSVNSHTAFGSEGFGVYVLIRRKRVLAKVIHAKSVRSSNCQMTVRIWKPLDVHNSIRA